MRRLKLVMTETERRIKRSRMSVFPVLPDSQRYLIGVLDYNLFLMSYVRQPPKEVIRWI